MFLQFGLEAWAAASRISRGVVASTLLNTSPGQKILVLSLPDSIHGAFVLRNGLTEALSLSGGSVNPDDVAVISSVMLNDEFASVFCAYDGAHIRLSGSDPRMRFYSRFIDPDSHNVSRAFLEKAPNRGFDLRHEWLQIDLGSFPAGAVLLCYEQGRMVPCTCTGDRGGTTDTNGVR